VCAYESPSHNHRKFGARVVINDQWIVYPQPNNYDPGPEFSG
jgi:hypothetical protein